MAKESYKTVHPEKISAAVQIIKHKIKHFAHPSIFALDYCLIDDSNYLLEQISPRQAFDIGVTVGQAEQLTDISCLVEIRRLTYPIKYNLEIFTLGLGFARALLNKPCPNVYFTNMCPSGLYDYTQPDREFMEVCKAVKSLSAIDHNLPLINKIISVCSTEAQRVMRIVFEHPEITPAGTAVNILSVIPPESPEILFCAVIPHPYYLIRHEEPTHMMHIPDEPLDKIFSKFPYALNTCREMADKQISLARELSAINAQFAVGQVAEEANFDLTTLEQLVEGFMNSSIQEKQSPAGAAITLEQLAEQDEQSLAAAAASGTERDSVVEAGESSAFNAELS